MPPVCAVRPCTAGPCAVNGGSPRTSKAREPKHRLLRTKGTYAVSELFDLTERSLECDRDTRRNAARRCAAVRRLRAIATLVTWRPGSTRYRLACRHWPAMTIMGLRERGFMVYDALFAWLRLLPRNDTTGRPRPRNKHGNH